MSAGNEIGDLLLDIGLITPEELAKAHEEQAKSGERLTLVLERLGLVSYHQLKDALELQFGVNFFSLSKTPPTREIADALKLETKIKHRVIPVAGGGTQYTIAMVDPDDLIALDSVRVELKCGHLKKMVCTADEFEFFVRDMYEVNKDGSTTKVVEVEPPKPATTAPARLPGSKMPAKNQLQSLFGDDDDDDDNEAFVPKTRKPAASVTSNSLPALNPDILLSPMVSPSVSQRFIDEQKSRFNLGDNHKEEASAPPNGSSLPTVADRVAASPSPASAPAPTPAPASASAPTPAPASASAPTPAPASASAPTPAPASASAPTPAPASASAPTPAPASASAPTPAPASASAPTPAPASASAPTPAPASASAPTPAPASASAPTPAPASASAPTPAPASASAPTPAPASASAPTPAPASAPAPAPALLHQPLPIATSDALKVELSIADIEDMVAGVASHLVESIESSQVLNNNASRQLLEEVVESELGGMEDTDINKLKEQQNSSIMLLAHEIIGKATQKRCSDIHLEPDSSGVTLRYFLHGELLADCVLPGEIHQALVSSYKIIAGLDPNELEKPQDKKIVTKVEDDHVELRITTLPSDHGEMVAISMRFV